MARTSPPRLVNVSNRDTSPSRQLVRFRRAAVLLAPGCLDRVPVSRMWALKVTRSMMAATGWPFVSGNGNGLAGGAWDCRHADVDWALV